MAREDVALTGGTIAAGPLDLEERVDNLQASAGGDHVRLCLGQQAILLLVTALLTIFGIVDFGGLVDGVYWTFVAVFVTSAAIRLAAVLTPRRRHAPAPLADDALPHYSLIVPLYREAEVARELVSNLDRLDYPRSRLQALIVLEADDHATQAAFHAMDLPAFIQVLVVPPGLPRTKPRACNVALQRARGELIVIYDAEDAPDPMQLREAAARFAAGDPALACLQAPLRVETPRALAFIPEQFRLEYAAHFEVLLPAFARWRLPFPLGGTSNHFKAEPLRSVGGWDAYNVTEDADIGFRLAAAGYQLATIDPPTLETAPASLAQWGPQRARWIKGHLQTCMSYFHTMEDRSAQPKERLVPGRQLGDLLVNELVHPTPKHPLAVLGIAADQRALSGLQGAQHTLAKSFERLHGFGISTARVNVLRDGPKPLKHRVVEPSLELFQLELARHFYPPSDTAAPN